MLTPNTEKSKKYLNNQTLIFLFGLILFVTAAIFGWVKLQYGFNFIDEGLHMTDSWRLTVGDPYFYNKFNGICSYPLINSSIFKAFPNITLLDFRKIQFILTLFCLSVFGLALYKLTNQYFYLPYIFSLFAFTGLDPSGVVSNLNYDTLPHLFVVLHISFLLLGLSTRIVIAKRLLFISSGLSLWGISLALLQLSPVVLSPILTYFACRKFKFKKILFQKKDLLFILGPFVISWALFVYTFNQPFLSAVYDTVFSIRPTHSFARLLSTNFNIEILKHTLLSLLAVSGIIFCIKKVPIAINLFLLSFFSIITYIIIETSFFNLIQPYFNGIFARPVWFSTFLISLYLLFWSDILKKFVFKKPLTEGYESGLLILIPATFIAIFLSLFSRSGFVMVLYSSIPAVAAFTVILLNDFKISQTNNFNKCLILIIILSPYYYTVSWADWKNTYFDVIPQKATATIQSGFGKGIKTNALYLDIYKWIKFNSDKHTEEEDFILSYVNSPMVNMIAKRKPSLGFAYIDFAEVTPDYYESSINRMILNSRQPKIAFIFERMPVLFPKSLRTGETYWPGIQFKLLNSNDPISKYVRSNMKFVDEFIISKTHDHVIRCYIDKMKQ